MQGSNKNRLGRRLVVLVALVVAVAVSACGLPHYVLVPPTPSPTRQPPTATRTAVPTSTATPPPTATPTRTPTPTPDLVVLRTPRPAEPGEPRPAGSLIAYTSHLRFFAEPDNYWGQQVADIGPAMEAELEKIAARLHTTAPDRRLRVSLQNPDTSPLVRGMQCPARGLYYGQSPGSEALMIIFADETISRMQLMAVAAHEIAHHLTFRRFGSGGDILLSEGLANWASADAWAQWQGWPSFDDAVRSYRRNAMYLPLEETLSFDASVADELGLQDCFGLRDLRYNEWTSFVDFLIGRYGFETIDELWRASPEDRQFSAERMAPTVDYRAVLDKTLEELEREWLETLYMERAD